VRVLSLYVTRTLACLLALVMLAAPGLAQAKPQENQKPASDAAQSTGTVAAQPDGNQAVPLPDSPGTVRSSPSPNGQNSNGGQRPAGTAAAEQPYITGVAASKPAGVAIAPAKQRRVRSFLIRVGAIVGAGVAVGSVVALTQGSPSRPPGAR